MTASDGINRMVRIARGASIKQHVMVDAHAIRHQLAQFVLQYGTMEKLDSSGHSASINDWLRKVEDACANLLRLAGSEDSADVVAFAAVSDVFPTEAIERLRRICETERTLRNSRKKVVKL